MDPSIRDYLHDNHLILDTSSINDEYLCGICNGIICEPMLLNCAHSFCEKCITNYQISNDKCKLCPSDIQANQIIENIRFKREIPDLKCYCPHLFCSSYLTIKDLVVHLNDCDKRGNHCPLNLIGCFQQLRDDEEIKTHIISDIIVHFRLMLDNMMDKSISIENLRNNYFENIRDLQNELNDLRARVPVKAVKTTSDAMQERMKTLENRTKLMNENLTNLSQKMHIVLFEEKVDVKSQQTPIHSLYQENSLDVENTMTLRPEVSPINIEKEGDAQSILKKTKNILGEEKSQQTPIHSLHQENSPDIGNTISLHPEVSSTTIEKEDTISLSKKTLSTVTATCFQDEFREEQSKNVALRQDLELVKDLINTMQKEFNIEKDKTATLQNELWKEKEKNDVLLKEFNAEKVKTSTLQEGFATEKVNISTINEGFIIEKANISTLKESFNAETEKFNALQKYFAEKLNTTKLQEELVAANKQKYSFLQDLTTVKSQLELVNVDLKDLKKKFNLLEHENKILKEELKKEKQNSDVVKIENKSNIADIQVPIEQQIMEPPEAIPEIDQNIDLFKCQFTNFRTKHKRIRHCSDIQGLRGYSFKIGMEIWDDGDVMFSVLSVPNTNQLEWPIPFRIHLQITDDSNKSILKHEFGYNELEKDKYQKPINCNFCLYSSSFLKLSRTPLSISVTMEPL